VDARNARALHVLRRRSRNPSRERKARYAESPQHDAPYGAGAIVATSGQDYSIAAVTIRAK
jgi:hypothetical protein